MLIIQLCQPLVLIFQFFKIFQQRTLVLLSLNHGSVSAGNGKDGLTAK